MLAYLVTSKTRRRLLELLWLRDETGSASELARTVRLSFATVYRELKAMEAAGLAHVRVEEGREVYAAAADHPDAELLRRLVRTRPWSAAPSGDASESVRARVRALGAPLQVSPEPVADEEREQALVDAVALSRRDATLAHVMPVVLWRLRHLVDRDRLRAAALRAREKHTLGFLLALTSKLSGDHGLAAWAESLRDRRVRGVRPYFELPSPRRPASAPAQRTPPVAKAWGFSMDLDLATFQAAFDKHTAVADA